MHHHMFLSISRCVYPFIILHTGNAIAAEWKKKKHKMKMKCIKAKDRQKYFHAVDKPSQFIFIYFFFVLVGIWYALNFCQLFFLLLLLFLAFLSESYQYRRWYFKNQKYPLMIQWLCTNSSSFFFYLVAIHSKQKKTNNKSILWCTTGE